MFIALHKIKEILIFILVNDSKFVSVTVIIPTHNEEETIAQTLESLLNQKIKPNQIVVVLDRCRDKTEKIVDELSQTHNEIMKIQKKTTKYAKTFMKAFVIAETINVALTNLNNFSEFIMIANGDSIYSKNYIEEALKILNEDKNCGLVGFSDYFAISGSGYIFRTKLLEKLGNQLVECAAEDTYLQFAILNQGFSIKPLSNTTIDFLRERGKGKIIDRLKYSFTKGFASYTLGYSFGFEILRTLYWIVKGKFTSITIIFGFLYAALSREKKLDIAFTDIPKKWQKKRIHSIFNS